MVKLLPVERLGIQVTTECDLKCAHCLVSCAPGYGKVMHEEELLSCIDAAARSGVRSIGFSGGEPLLHVRLLRKAIRHAAQQGITPQVITNANWARDGERRREILTSLSEAGLARLDFSHDIFHLPFVGREVIAGLVDDATNVGIPVKMVTTLSPHANSIEILRFAADLEVEVLLTPVSRMGRARSLLASHFLAPHDIGVCRQANAPLILVDGRVVFCCGFADLVTTARPSRAAAVLGNVRSRELECLLNETALCLRSAFVEHRIDTLFSQAVTSTEEIRIEVFRSACDVCHFLLDSPDRVTRIEALGRGEVALPESVPPSRSAELRFFPGLEGKRLRLRQGVQLVRNLLVCDWFGRFENGTGFYDVLCVPQSENHCGYHVVGRTISEAAESLLSGKTLSAEDPEAVDLNDASKRIEETLRRWMIVRLYQIGALELAD